MILVRINLKTSPVIQALALSSMSSDCARLFCLLFYLVFILLLRIVLLFRVKYSPYHLPAQVLHEYLLVLC